MRITLRNNFAQFARRLERAALAGLSEASGTLWDRVRDNLNTGYPPASRPGGFLHRRSGDGRRSFVFYRSLRRAPRGELAYVCGTSSDRLVEQERGRHNYMAWWERRAPQGRRRIGLQASYRPAELRAAFVRGFRNATRRATP